MTTDIYRLVQPAAVDNVTGSGLSTPDTSCDGTQPQEQWRGHTHDTHAWIMHKTALLVINNSPALCAVKHSSA